MTKVIGFVDKSWKPKRKSPLEQQIDREDTQYWADKEEDPLEYHYKPAKFELTETAKFVFGGAIEFIRVFPKL